MKKNYFLIKILVIYLFLISNVIAKQQNYLNKGIELFQKKEFDKSKILFEKDIVFDPKSEKSYLYLAKIFGQNNDDEQQEINLNNVLLLNPENDEAIYMLTLLKIKQSDYNYARELIDKFILICESFCSKENEIRGKLKTTRKIKIETMIPHAKTVKDFARKSLVVFDMPYKTYTNKFIAYKNAKKIMRLTKCDAIKLEGGKKIVNIIKYLTKRKIPVIGHVGLLPQTSINFKVKGKNFIQKKQILEDAKAVSNSGVFAIIIECVVENLAKIITKNISVPTIGIGASKYCDGQILVVDDILGLSDFYPKFVKQYSNLKKIIEKSVKDYAKDVKLRKFPSNKNVYK